MKSLHLGASATALNLSAAPKPLRSEMEAGNAERVRLYHSAHWLKRRAAFLREHPLCVECAAAGYIVPAIAVDHIDGHQRADWRERFWDERRWQALCSTHHAEKSAR